MLKPNEIVAARGLLRWSREDLAEESGVHSETIKKIETGSTDNPRINTLTPIIDAFARNGVEFIEGGVRKRRDKVRVLEGASAITTLFDDIISTLRDCSLEERELLIFGVDEEKFLKHYPLEKLQDHLEQRQKYQISQKLMLCEGDNNFVGNPDSYRWIPEEYFSTTPTLVYGTKVATILWSTPPQVILADNDLYAFERRKNFRLMWDKSSLTPVTG